MTRVAFWLFWVLGVGLLTGCAIETSLPEEEINRPLITGRPVAPKATAESYGRLISKTARVRGRKVYINGDNIPLMSALMGPLPDLHVVPRDGNVNLKRPVSVYANGTPLESYLLQLTGVADYRFELKGSTIYVSSVDERVWNVAALAGKRTSIATIAQNGGGNTSQEGTASKVEVLVEEDTWKSILDGATSMLGVEKASEGELVNTDSAGTDAGSLGVAKKYTAEFKPYVVGVRSQGVISAGGSPAKMQVLDSWIRNLGKASKRQVRMDLNAFDVTLRDERGRGIDWDLFYKKGGEDSFTFSGAAPIDFTGAGAWTVAATASDARTWSVDALLQFLGEYGEVSVLNQPSLTITNGASAIINSNDEFSYVASFEQAQDAQGQITVTPVTETRTVGLSMAITARILDDERILIEVTPMISSLQGFDNIVAQNFTLNLPRIALQELSTQVIARSGETVQLGGLISRKITESLSRIPWKDSDGGVVNFLFSSVRNSLERRELVVTITPTLVEG